MSGYATLRVFCLSLLPYLPSDRAGDYDRRFGSREAEARLLEEPRVALVEAPSNERLQRTWPLFSDSIDSVNNVAFDCLLLPPKGRPRR